MALGIVFRKELSQKYSRKFAWSCTAFLLSITMLALSVDNVSVPRQMVLFLFALSQATAALFIFATCLRLRSLIQEFQQKSAQENVASAL